jgi:YebC/PmpR family DNA-binding regulatory protein
MKKLGKCSKEITSAIREQNGDADPATNLRLRLILDKAKKMNMPKHVIDRAIKSATDKDTVAVERVFYEATGPCGVSFVIECLTDKRTRTAQNMRVIFSKNGGSMGTKTMWTFQQRGSVTASLFIPRDKFTDQLQESIELFLIDQLSEEDYEAETIDHSDSDEVEFMPFIELKFTVLTNPGKVHDLNKVITNSFINSADLKTRFHVQKTDSEMSIIYYPTTTINVTKQEDTENLLKITELLEDDDDVVSVYHNAKFIDE